MAAGCPFITLGWMCSESSRPGRQSSHVREVSSCLTLSTAVLENDLQNPNRFWQERSLN